jgi:hypothetical protein
MTFHGRASKIALAAVCAGGLVTLALACRDGGAPTGPDAARARAASRHEFTTDLGVDRCTFADRGRNRFFDLTPGYVLELGGEEDGEVVSLIITVLHETRDVAGIGTRIVEERESKGGELVEVSRNFFALCKENGGVYYFGEEVDIYEDGEIVSHDGAWLHGRDGARAGLAMPGLPLLGARYFQEIAPEVALDRAEILRLDESLSTPAGNFQNVLIVEETTPLEPDARERKLYAPDVGLIRDGELLLLRYGSSGAR